MLNSAPLSFGPFVLDAEGAELRKNSAKVDIRPKCFDVLLYLAAHAGRVISKEELLENVWRDVVVNEATLNRTVTDLRAALGDDANNPQYVETVSRRGYKFIGQVRPATVKQAASNFVLVHGDREFALRDGEYLIGRGDDAAIPIYASSISRHHARIVIAGKNATLEDLGSRNGTYVNAKRISGLVELHSGDEIRIGSDCLVLWSRAGETASLGSR